MIVEKDKLYFCTGRGKDFYRQLMKRPDVAVTGLNKDFQMVRLSGKAEKLADQKHWIDRIFEENPVMNGVYGKNPIYRESFVFGSAEASREAPQNTGKEAQICHAPREKGFLITDVCIGCGKCMRACPQQCITKGIPFLIHQEHCLHCGLCFENCPVQAIVRRGA